MWNVAASCYQKFKGQLPVEFTINISKFCFGPSLSLGTEILFPDTWPLVFCHGICKRWRGKPLLLIQTHLKLKTCLRALDVLIVSSCFLSAFFPSVKGPGVLRGAGEVLRRRDRVGSGLPACWKECGVSWSEGKLAEASSDSFHLFLTLCPPSLFSSTQAGYK